MTTTAFEVHGVLFLVFFGGGVLIAVVSGLIFLFHWFSGGDKEQAMNRASIRGLIALAMMAAGFFFIDRAVTKVEGDGFIIEIEPSPLPPPKPVPVVRIA